MITIYGDVILDVYMNVEFVKPSPESTGNVYRLLNGTDFSDFRLGGAAAVAAIMRYYCNPDLCLVAPIGLDNFGRKLENLLVDKKINHELDYIEKRKTTAKFRHVCNGRLLQDRFDLQEYYPYTVDFVPTRTLVIADYANGACEHIADKIDAFRHTSNIIVDPDPARNWQEAYKGAHVIKCNRLEAIKQVQMHLADLPNRFVEDQYKELAKNLNCILVITNGPKDIEVYSDGPTMTVGVEFPVNATDVTGAGDTITAILAAELDKEHKEITLSSVVKALNIAQKFAAQQIKHLGVTYDLTFTN